MTDEFARQPRIVTFAYKPFKLLERNKWASLCRTCKTVINVKDFCKHYCLSWCFQNVIDLRNTFISNEKQQHDCNEYINN